MPAPVNQVFRASKTRRFVSAWMMNRERDEIAATLERFSDTIDQVVFMCGGARGDGKLPGDWPVADRKAMAKRLAGMGISTLNDYGGGARDGADQLIASPRKRKEVIKRMVDESDRVGTDGVDIDFEHLPADNRFRFNDFIAELGEALHAANKMLSICVYALSAEARREVGVGFWDTSVLARHADQLRAMTYDLYCPPSRFIGPTSTAPWGRETMAYMATQVPRHKIVMGLPTYSVDWNITDPTKSTQVNDWRWLEKVESKSPMDPSTGGRGWAYYWDVNVIRFTDDQGHAHIVWVSDARSTKSHLATVDHLDLAGVSFWVLGGEDPRIWECVREHFKRWG